MSKARRISRDDLLAALACVAFGLLISLLPHLLRWWWFGDAGYVTDNDDLLYLEFAAKAFFNHPASLADPVFAADLPTMYPWLQFAPAIMITKALGLGPFQIAIFWRIWAGASIGLLWYVLIRQFIKTPALAACLALVFFADLGVLFGKPFYIYALSLAKHAKYYGTMTPQWRIITPGLSLAALLAYFTFLVRAVRKPSTHRVVCAGAALGLLFYTYFYFWTTAGLGLALACVVDWKRRTTYFKVGVIGVLVGMPVLILSAMTKKAMHPEALPRNDSFLPIRRVSELMIPKFAILVVVAFFAFFRKKREDLVFLAAFAAAAIILLNEQIFTGLLISNFHWNYALGPSISFLIFMAAKDYVPKSLQRMPLAAIIGAAVAFYAGGFALRVYDITRHEEASKYSAGYLKYKEQRLTTKAPRLVPNSVFVGQYLVGDLAAILERQRQLYSYSARISLSIDNEDIDWRAALYFYLRGQTSNGAEAFFRQELIDTATGPWLRDPRLFAERVRSRVSKLAEIERSPETMLDRYGVRYVAFDSSERVPTFIKEGWNLIQDGPTWRIWERRSAKLSPSSDNR